MDEVVDKASLAKHYRMARTRPTGKPLPTLISCPRNHSSSPGLQQQHQQHHHHQALLMARQAARDGIRSARASHLDGGSTTGGISALQQQPQQQQQQLRRQQRQERGLHPGLQAGSRAGPRAWGDTGSAKRPRAWGDTGSAKRLWDDLGSLIRQHGHDDARVHMPPTRCALGIFWGGKEGTMQERQEWSIP